MIYLLFPILLPAVGRWEALQVVEQLHDTWLMSGVKPQLLGTESDRIRFTCIFEKRYCWQVGWRYCDSGTPFSDYPFQCLTVLWESFMCFLNSLLWFNLITSYPLQHRYWEWIISFFYVSALMYLKSAFMFPLALSFELNHIHLYSVILIDCTHEESLPAL